MICSFLADPALTKRKDLTGLTLLWVDIRSMRLKILLNILVSGSLAGCDQRPATVSNPNDIYFDYRITGEENDDVACVLQYKRGGPDGEAIMIREPGSVELDGVRLEADSAGFSGIYYEQYIPSEEFIGTHSIVHTSPDKKTYIE